MINNEYKNSSEVYKVQTFRTTHFLEMECQANIFWKWNAGQIFVGQMDDSS